MNDTAIKPLSNETQHTLQWSAFKPRAIASKPLNLTNFDNPLPFISMGPDNDKRKWENRDDDNDNGRKKQHLNGARSPSSDDHSIGSAADMNTTSVEAKARRKAQNRAAQRAFRERKEKYVQELEGKIKQMEQAHKQETVRLLENNQNLMSLIQKLEAEVLSLKNKSPSMSDGKTENGPSIFSGSPLLSDRSRDDEATDDSVVSREDARSNLSGSQEKQQSLGSRNCGSYCRTTKDGISFCTRLKEEVCSSAFERLLSESIFDNSGEINNAIEPVPIVTTPMPIGLQTAGNTRGRKFSTFQKNFLRDSHENDEYDLSSGTSEAFKHEPHPDTLHPGTQLITCSQVWERLCEHPQFEEFDIEELCAQLKSKAKCSGSGPVIEEDELQEVLEALEAKLVDSHSV
ncbi:hypothetical protein Unana1_04747 [Umbelopsis nana]